MTFYAKFYGGEKNGERVEVSVIFKVREFLTQYATPQYVESYVARHAEYDSHEKSLTVVYYADAL